MNLFLPGSPWHALISKALINHDRMTAPQFVIEGVSENSTLAIQNVLTGFENAVSGVVNFDEVLVERALRRSHMRYARDLQERLSSLSAHLRMSRFETIFVFNLDSPVSRQIIETARYDRLVKVEDGIIDYLSISLRPQPFFRRTIKCLLTSPPSLRTKYWATKRPRPDLGYFFFPDKLCPDFPLQSLNDTASLLVNELRDLSIKGTEADARKDSCLMLGQSLAEDKTISLKEELLFYEEQVARLVDKYQITIKPHPRSCRAKLRFFDELSNKDGRVCLDHSHGTAEHLLATGRFCHVVGMWSLPVIYSLMLFGVQGQSMMARLFDRFPRLRNRHLHHIHQELLQIFPEEYQQL